MPSPPRRRVPRAGGLPSSRSAAAWLGVLAFPRFGIWPLAFVSVAALSVAVDGRAQPDRRLARLRLRRWRSSCRCCTGPGVYVGPVPWLILAAGRCAAFFAVLGAVLPVVQRLPAGAALGGRGVGAAGGAARPAAVRRVPVGPAGLQPGRVAAALVRRAGRRAAGDLRRRARRRRPGDAGRRGVAAARASGASPGWAVAGRGRRCSALVLAWPLAPAPDRDGHTDDDRRRPGQRARPSAWTSRTGPGRCSTTTSARR